MKSALKLLNFNSQKSEDEFHSFDGEIDRYFRDRRLVLVRSARGWKRGEPAFVQPRLIPRLCAPVSCALTLTAQAGEAKTWFVRSLCVRPKEILPWTTARSDVECNKTSVSFEKR